MAVTEFYGPFDSGVGSTLNQDEWGDFFGSIIATGVVKGGKLAQVTANDLAVSLGSGLHSEIATGLAWVAGWFYRLSGTGTLELTHDAADPSNPRIDTVILKLDVAAKTLTAAIKKGTPSGTPVSPALSLTQNGSTYEFPLRDVNIAAGATSMTLGTDRRTYAIAVLQGLAVGHSSGNIPVSDGTVNTDLNADKLDGNDSSAFVKVGSHNTASGLTLSAGTGVPGALDPHEAFIQFTNV